MDSRPRAGAYGILRADWRVKGVECAGLLPSRVGGDVSLFRHETCPRNIWQVCVMHFCLTVSGFVHVFSSVDLSILFVAPVCL